jgi:hypothetical protein
MISVSSMVERERPRCKSPNATSSISHNTPFLRLSLILRRTCYSAQQDIPYSGALTFAKIVVARRDKANQVLF